VATDVLKTSTRKANIEELYKDVTEAAGISLRPPGVTSCHNF